MERNKGVEFLHYCNVLFVAQIICLESCLWHRLSVMSKKEWQCRLVYLIYSEKAYLSMVENNILIYFHMYLSLFRRLEREMEI